MQFTRAITQLPGQSDDFSNDKFRNATGIAERRVEDCNSMLGCILQIDLIGPNAEATNHNEVLGRPQYLGRQFGFGTDPDNMDISVGSELERVRVTIGAAGKAPHRIFAINSSSGREDLRNSTW